MNEVAAPGWDAIEAAIRRLYGAQEPRHVGYTPGLAYGSGLQGCSAYRAADHWHFVTYGLTELWAKESGSDPAISGWGYELTIRVRAPASPSAPNWPFDLLEKVARYTHRNSHPFAVGDRLDPGSPITGQPDTSLVAIAFALDPALPRIDSANGRLEFRQLVGITREELEEMRQSSTAVVLDRIRVSNPLLITDPGR